MYSIKKMLFCLCHYQTFEFYYIFEGLVILIFVILSFVVLSGHENMLHFMYTIRRPFEESSVFFFVILYIL
jgi:hypothetical protein